MVYSPGRNHTPLTDEFRGRIAEHAKALWERRVTNWQSATAQEFGVHRDTVGRCLRARYPELRTAERRDAPAPPADESGPPTAGAVAQSVEQTEAGDRLDVSARNTAASTPAELMAEVGVDPDEWELVSFTKKRSQSLYVPRAVRGSDAEGWTRAPGDEHARVVTLYHVAATFKRKTAVMAAREEIAALLEHARERIVPPVLAARPAAGSGLLLEIGPCDHHFGMRAWPAETGDDAYDLGIAVETYRRAFRTLVERAGARPYERGLLMLGQDGLHVDGIGNTTTKGTPQDTDGRYPKVFRAYWQTVCEEIAWYVENVGPLLVLAIPGNHDGVSALLAGQVVEARFHGCPHVEVDAEPRTRKYVEWGRNLLGFTHLDDVKPEQLYRLMAREQPEAWARTGYREWHTGHPHTRRAYEDEINGVRVRCLPSLTPATAWAARMGLVGNVRSSEAFVWDREEGMIGSAAVNLRPA